MWRERERESDAELDFQFSILAWHHYIFYSQSRKLLHVAKFFVPAISTASVFLEMDRGKDQTSANKKMSVVAGPWGGNGGTTWDDGTHEGIREITLVYGDCIDSLRVVYDRNGKPFMAEKHGGVGGPQKAEIKLQYPDEFLVSVSGYYCPVVYGGSPVIRSVTFKSNQRTFGPFGVEEGTPFALTVEGGGRVVGMYGRSGWYLDSIGFRLSQVRSPKLLQKVQKKLQRLTSTASKT
ncbi:hypothetical protein SLE2022_384360 [Rubroshorea leprosula]